VAKEILVARLKSPNGIRIIVANGAHKIWGLEMSPQKKPVQGKLK
jgi:hypothetical protein